MHTLSRLSLANCFLQFFEFLLEFRNHLLLLLPNNLRFVELLGETLVFVQHILLSSLENLVLLHLLFQLLQFVLDSLLSDSRAFTDVLAATDLQLQLVNLLVF